MRSLRVMLNTLAGKPPSFEPPALHSCLEASQQVISSKVLTKPHNPGKLRKVKSAQLARKHSDSV